MPISTHNLYFPARESTEEKSQGDFGKRSTNAVLAHKPMPKFNKPKKKVKKEVIYHSTAEETAHMQEVKQQCMDQAPPRGEQTASDESVSFSSLPLSRRTAKGLEIGGFVDMTRIQVASIPHALCGRDVLGAAKTGSGKTLSFLIPLIEALWKEGWGPIDGLGGVVISPTRELAIQIFEVLRKVGQFHSFSAGMLIGGKRDFREEQARVGGMSILVATPGRLLQHLEQTPGFDAGNCQVLVLDEADRILDMGFSEQLNSVIQYLPAKRQTMLFSATQTKSVRALARLSLSSPEFVAVHSMTSTPAKLAQHYMVIPLQDKLDCLFSFIKTHLKQKSIIFFSTAAQVRFVFECFRTLQPGVPLMALHGKIKQGKRTETFLNFESKKAAVLFATDIAARGLDFPEVDWVVQVDCPEDIPMYIHRVGRTARYASAGKSLLFVTPAEEQGMISALANSEIQPKKLAMNPNRRVSIATKAAAVNASRAEVKQLATKAYTSYVHSISLMPNKDIFDVSKVPLEEYARSLGLATQPQLPFLRDDVDAEQAREETRQKKNKNRKLERLKELIKEEKARKKRAREEGVAVDTAKKVKKSSADSEEEEGFLVFKGKFESDATDQAALPTDSKKPTKEEKLRIDAAGRANKASARNQKILFNDSGEAGSQPSRLTLEEMKKNTHEEELTEANDSFIQKVKSRLAATADQDKQEARDRVRTKHAKKRHKEKQHKGTEDGDSAGPTLAMVDLSDTEGSEGDERSMDEGEESSGESERGMDDDITSKEDAVLALLGK